MSHRLTLSPYLQTWDGTNLSIRVLIAPRGNPLEPLGTGEPAFVDLAPQLEVRQISGLDGLPTLTSPSTREIITLPVAPRAREICLALETVLPIDAAAPPIDPRVPGVRFMKYAPKAYREATGYGGDRNPYVVTGDRYRCEIERKIPPGTSIRVEDKKLPWGKVLGLALRQPLLAEAVGIVRTFTIQPAPGQFEAGGWVYITLAPGTPAASLLTTPGAVKLYAARVPALTASRRLFTAVLFPVNATVPPVSYDEVFREAVDYDDGFAKTVYVAQPEHLDPLSETDDGTRPTQDIGIQIGWDDEQVANWLNRQVQPAAALQDAPMGVLGYRIDVRESGQADWSSLVLGRTKLVIDSVDLGAYEGEFRIEIAPNKLMGDESGDYWCPAYFTDWNGASLAGPDVVGLRLQEIDPSGPIQGINPAVVLRYGRPYDFRVRLVDHTGGGPINQDLPINPSPQPNGSLLFQRHVRPGAVVLSDSPTRLASAPDRIAFRRPRLGYPAYLFAGGNATDLFADLAQSKLEQRSVGLSDPDVDAAEIRVLVERPDTETGWKELYVVQRQFPAVATDELSLDLEWVDVADATALTAPAVGSLPLPTSRNVRLEIVPLATERLNYYAALDVRYGEVTRIDLRRPAKDETALIVPHPLQGYYLQPDLAIDPTVQIAQKAAGHALASPDDALGRLAEVLNLGRINYGLRALPKHRIIFGCSSQIRHILGPDGASIRFASDGDITRQWIVAVRVILDRDWSWDGLQFLLIERDGVEVGRLEMRRSVGDEAEGAPESQTELLFLDAIDPKPAPGNFPRELNPTYHLIPKFRVEPETVDASESHSIRLPMTTPPTQIPRLVSAGLALSPYLRDENYTQTEMREQVLWFEFDAPPDNPADCYFLRVLANSPDPVIARTFSLPEEVAEPPLPINPELIRAIVPGQSDDQTGISAMQLLQPTESDRHFIVPLPPGLTASSLELFGFFTYEIRIGHFDGWSTSQGRFGRPLRVTGVQHPAPQLDCSIVRRPQELEISANFALPIHKGQPIWVLPPATEIWVLLYCQVKQADNTTYRNVLISHKQAQWNYQKWERESRRSQPPDASVSWSSHEIEDLLDVLGLGKHTPLSCVVVETLPADQPIVDPVGAGLGYERFLRTSPLTPIPLVC